MVDILCRNIYLISNIYFIKLAFGRPAFDYISNLANLQICFITKSLRIAVCFLCNVISTKGKSHWLEYCVLSA